MLEPPTASRRNGTGVLWVLTKTHLCDDPPRQGGGSPERQLVPCVDCIEWLLVHCEVVIVNQIMLFATLYVLYLWATVHTPVGWLEVFLQATETCPDHEKKSPLVRA